MKGGRDSRDSTFVLLKRCLSGSRPANEREREREREGLRPWQSCLTPFLDGQDVFDWWTHDPAFRERHQGEISDYEDTLFEEDLDAETE